MKSEPKAVVTFRADPEAIRTMKRAADHERLPFTVWIRETCLRIALKLDGKRKPS